MPTAPRKARPDDRLRIEPGMTTSSLDRESRDAAHLQRLDLDLAELDHALVVLDTVGLLQPEAVLQRDPAGSKLGVLRTDDGFLPVQRHGEGRALRADFIVV